MAERAPDPWADDTPDLPPPEPAPRDWAAPTPLEAKIEVKGAVEVQDEERELRRHTHSKKRRFWTTTFVYLGLWLASLLLIHVDGFYVFTPLIFLLPLYLLTLPFVLRTPKRLRGAKAKLVDRIGWQSRLMISIVVFLGLYIPFLLVSNAIIPYAALVEYGLFALLLFILIRLAGRSTGVAPSLDALPPPSHRLHQQVVAPIDDLHYQQTLWLNYTFVEKGKGVRSLARRLDQVLEGAGVKADRRQDLLKELDEYRDDGGFAWTRRGRERRTQDRSRRGEVLQRLFDQVNRELEQSA